MNVVALVGRITHDIELRKSNNGTIWTRITIAINSGEEEVDFVNVVAYEKVAETLGKYMKKGSQIGVNGRIKTGQYEHEKGVKINTFDIVASRIKFLDSKDNDHVSIVNNSTDDLPF